MRSRGLLVMVVLVAGLALLANAQRMGGFRGGPGRGARMEGALPLGKSEAEKKVLATIQEVYKSGDTYLNVPVEDGRLLRVLAESTGAKNAVELGTSTGLSGLWLSMALMGTGGKLTTFEIDAGRAASARANFKRAGVDHLISVIEGDAHQNVLRLKDPVDLVFIDADKEGYVDYLNKLLPLVRPGGLIIAHNVNSAPDYIRAVTANPELETVFGGQGQDVGITVKKR